MKKPSDEKNDVWTKYTQSGKLKHYLESLRLSDQDIQAILMQIDGSTYKDDYKVLKNALGSDALHKMNSAIRAANYAVKHHVINMRVKKETHDRLKIVKKRLDADSIDEAIYYVTSKFYDHDDLVENMITDPQVQSLESINDESMEARLYSRLQGLDKRTFGHHYYKSVAPQLAICARRGNLCLTKAKALKQANKLGIREDDLLAMDFGDERRKIYPIFQFHKNITEADIDRLKDAALSCPDQILFASLTNNLEILESSDYRDVNLFVSKTIMGTWKKLDSLTGGNSETRINTKPFTDYKISGNVADQEESNND